MTKILFNIDDDRLKQLDVIAVKNGWSRAEAIRYAVDDLIANESGKEALAAKAFGLWRRKNSESIPYKPKL